MTDKDRRRIEGPGRSSALRGPLKAVLAAVVLLACAGLVALILSNRSSIVTLGPTNADETLDAAFHLVRNPQATAADLDHADALARATLRRQPLNSVAMSLLGNVRLRQNREADAEKLMNAAGRINHRENIAQLWLFDHLMGESRYDEAFLIADALLRRQRDFTVQLMPKITASLNNPAAVEALAKRLAKEPPWRSNVSESFVRSQSNASAQFTLYAAIKKAGGQVAPGETMRVLNGLLTQGRYDEAYLDWLLLLPDKIATKVSYVYDGDFDSLPDVSPFGWGFNYGAIGYVEPPAGRNDNALHIVYDGVSSHRFPGQLLVIPPGAYRFAGQVMSATPETVGHMDWAIVCANDASRVLLTTNAPDTAGAWKSFSTPFSTPPGCPAQTLVLRAATAGRRENIDLWYDKLSIQPEQAGR